MTTQYNTVYDDLEKWLEGENCGNINDIKPIAERAWQAAHDKYADQITTLQIINDNLKMSNIHIAQELEESPKFPQNRISDILPWLDNTEFVLNLTDNIQVKVTRMPINEGGYCASVFLNKCLVNLDSVDLAAKRIVEFVKQEFTIALTMISNYENLDDV